MSYQTSSKLHIVAVVAVIRNRDGKYLVLKRHENEIAYPGMYTFPGGKVEGNDTIEETLIKEVREEAGLALLPGKILLKDKSVIRPDGQSAKYFSYLCLAKDGDVVISDEFSGYKWVSVADLAHLPHVGIEEELKKADAIFASSIDWQLFATISVKEDLTQYSKTS